MIESVVIGILFLLAIAYLGNLVWKQFSKKNTAGCAKGCGACGNIDFQKIEQEVAAKEKKRLENVSV